MKFKLLIVWILMITFGSTNELSIKKIKDVYYTLSKQIDACSKKPEAEACDLYQNQIIVNSEDKGWYVTGKHYETRVFHYGQSDPSTPFNLSDLKKITNKYITGLWDNEEEWLFEKGILIFYYIKEGGVHTAPAIESRYYFESEKLIKYTKNSQDMDIKKVEKNTLTKIKSETEKWQKVFLTVFE